MDVMTIALYVVLSSGSFYKEEDVVFPSLSECVQYATDTLPHGTGAGEVIGWMCVPFNEEVSEYVPPEQG